MAKVTLLCRSGNVTGSSALVPSEVSLFLPGYWGGAGQAKSRPTSVPMGIAATAKIPSAVCPRTLGPISLLVVGVRPCRWEQMGASGCSSSSCFGPGKGFALASLLWGLAGLGAHGGLRLSAPQGLGLEELTVGKQSAKGMEEAVWCGQPPWEDAALSDGGESGFFCFHIPNKGPRGMEAAITPVISWAPLTHSEPHLQYSMSSSRRAVLGYLFTTHRASGCVWGRSKRWTVRGGVSPRSEAVAVGFCLPLPCPQVSSHHIKACSRQWVLGGCPEPLLTRQPWSRLPARGPVLSVV